LKENNGNEPYKKRNEVWQAATALRQCAIFRVYLNILYLFIFPYITLPMERLK
jgi:hypothetical protein